MNAVSTQLFPLLPPAASIAASPPGAEPSIFSSARSNSSEPRTGIPKTVTPRTTRKKRRKVAMTPAEEPRDEFHECLHQAEICREQAQEAARLKRFKAARGLFQTAIALCQRAMGLRRSTLHSSGPAEASAPPEDGLSSYLQVLTVEMTTYADLARSLERPIVEKSLPEHIAA
jgi:hypothetical protein